jgi:hypothetical protein
MGTDSDRSTKEPVHDRFDASGSTAAVLAPVDVEVTEDSELPEQPATPAAAMATASNAARVVVVAFRFEPVQ